MSRNKSEPHLSAADIKALMDEGGRLDWHPEYEREHWRDKPAPIEVLFVWKMPREKKETWMVGYRCSVPGCLGCRHPTSPSGTFHHKMIRKGGLDLWGRGEEKKVGKNKWEVVLVDQPVFRRYE